MCYEIRHEGEVKRFTNVKDAARFLQENMPQTALELRRRFVYDWDMDDVYEFVTNCTWLREDGTTDVTPISMTEDALECVMEEYFDGYIDQEKWLFDVIRWNGEGPELEPIEEE